MASRQPNHLPPGYNQPIPSNSYPNYSQPVYSQPVYYQQPRNNPHMQIQNKALSPQPQISRQFFDQYAQPNRVLSPPPVLQTGYPNRQQQIIVNQNPVQGNQSRQSQASENRQGSRQSDVNINDLTQSTQKKELIPQNVLNQQTHFINQNPNQPHMVMYQQNYQIPHPSQYQANYMQMVPNQIPQNYPIQQQYPPQMMPPPPQGQQMYYYEGQGQEGQDLNDPMIWNRRFFFIFERFEWAYQRCEMLKADYQQVHQQLKVVDSQDDWNALKQKHEQLLQKFMELQQQMAAVLGQNQQLLQERPQSNDEMWSQRYQQLLENYKSLQQQMESRQNQIPQGANDSQIQKQYRDLKVQYTKIFNEYKDLKRKQTRQQSQKQQIMQKYDELADQNQKYKNHLQKIHQDYDQLTNAYQQVQTNNLNLKRQIASKPKIDKSQYDRFMQIISQKEDQIIKMRKEFANRQNQRYMMQEQISIQNNQIQSLKGIINRMEHQSTGGVKQQYSRMISIKNEQIQNYRKMLKGIQEEYQLKIDAVQQQTRRQSEDAINELQREIIQLRQKIQESQSTHQLKMSNSQKKINFVEQQVSGLQQVINQKNQQILQLRGLTYQLQNYKALQKQCVDLNDQKIEFLNQIKSKDKQIEQLKINIENQRNQLKETYVKKIEIATKSIKDQLNQVKEILNMKDTQISKLRNNQQNKERSINQLQAECDVERSKNISLQRNFQNQRQNFRKQIRALQTRNNDLDRKVRHLQFDFGESVKNSLQSQISTLRSQNYSKQQIISKLENSQIQLRGKISHLQRQKKDIQLSYQQAKSKSIDYNQQKNEFNRKIEGLINDIHSRDRIMKTFQIHEENSKNQLTKLKNQIVQNQNTIKVKSSVIDDLQKKVRLANETLYDTIKQKDNFKIQISKNKEQYESMIRNMKDQLDEYQDLINSGKLSKDLELANSQNLQMISSLRLQNDKLKKQISRGFQSDASSRVTGLASSKVKKSGQGLNFIQKRLFDFNSKLQQMINEQNSLTTRSKNKQNYSQNVYNQYKEQIKSLKGKLSQLQKYCSALQIRVGDQIFQTNVQSTAIFAEQQRLVQQQIQFHKSQTIDFEERIQNLLKVNKQLKGRLDSLLKTNSENSAVAYYKQQLTNTQKNVQNLSQKMNKLIDQNRSLRSQMGNLNAKYSKQFDEKHFDTENRIEQLTRKVRLLQIEKVSATNQRATFLHDISQYESNMEIMKSNLGQKITMVENINQDLTYKIQKYQNEIRQLHQKLQ